MAATPSKIVVVGASLAGGTAALALREHGYAGELTLMGEEPARPYERPPLSKALLIGERDEPDWVGGEKPLSDRDITVLRDTVVTRISPAGHTVTAGGTEHPYDKLVLATGSAARRLDLPGFDLPGVCTLRTLDDAWNLRERISRGTKVVVVGAGWIGCEVAAASVQRGAAVTMIEPESAPLIRVLGGQVGAYFAGLHETHGVDLRLGIGVVGFAGEDAVHEVRLAGGGSVEADVVVVGVGAVPNIALADQAGLTIEAGGVAVDAGLRTSDPDIWAVGDIAAHAHPKYSNRVRVEHWANAGDQGQHVAQNVLGADEPYLKRPFFFSDQYEMGCEYRGLADPTTDKLLIRGDLEGGEFIAFWLRDGTVAAAMNVNSWDDGDALQDLVDTGRIVDGDTLVNGDLSAS